MNASTGRSSAAPTWSGAFPNDPAVGRRYRTVVAAMEDRYRAMAVLASRCSMRIGEILALTRGDIHIQAGTVSVDKSACDLGNRQRHVGPPKTAAGVRVMFVPPHVRGLIADYLDTFTRGELSGIV